jgi:hypothetical protein
MGRPTPQSVRDQLSPWIVGRETADGEARGWCPICETPGESSTPSASFRFSEGVFTCFSRCGGMSIPNLMKAVKASGDLERESKTAENQAKVRNIKDAPSAAHKLPSEEQLDEFVDRLLANHSALRAMREKRGYTKKTIEEFQIGWDGTRYTIPIRDRSGTLVNVRRYKLNAKEPKDKMRSWATGTGSRRLFLEDILDTSDTVIITEGETDALLGRQYGLPTISHTAGASAWYDRWNEAFEGKIVYICYDCDDAGRRGARKVARSLELFAKQVHIISLPLKGKGDDLSNYFFDQGYEAADFYELMAQASSSVNRASHLSSLRSGEAKEVSLEGTMDPDNHEKAVIFSATVAGKVQPSFVAPRRVEFNCSEGGGNRCARCPISGRNHLEVDIAEHDPIVLEVLNKNGEARQKTLLRHVNIPHTCPDVEVEEPVVYSVEELILVPPADEQVGSMNSVDRKVFNVGPYDTPVNTKVRFTGMNTTSSQDGRGVLQAWESERSSADIDKFTMDEKTYNDLMAFWPKETQTPIDKLKEIVSDLEANVTKIYHRPELHVAYDLVWHSVLDFKFKGVDVGKGWLELLVIGDTRTGKSEAAKRLCHHYRAGVLTTCEGATFAGLVGGVQQMSNTWVVSWGTVPLNDRRLVVLDEFGGIAEKGILEQMSSVRSSGIAQINKIKSSETKARTRLIWIANPVDGSTVESYANGAMDAVKGLAKNPEDIARFDFALAVASRDVTAEQINVSRPPRVQHRYTQDLCSKLIHWVWSRTVDQIVWEPGVENYVLARAQVLGARYIPEPPLIQVENVRIKLARMAVAVAGRLFSADETGDLLIVGEEHVNAAERLLNAFYRMESFGYLAHSESVLYERAQAQRNIKAVRNYLAANPEVLDTLDQCLGQAFKMRDFQEFGAMSQMEAQEVVRVLQGHRMIRRTTKGYIRIEPALVELIKKLKRAAT